MITPPDFDELYTADHDPWRVGSSFYERRKRATVLAALGRERYGWAWDPACGTGHLALELADRCERVSASDASSVAVQLAARRCADRPNVQVDHGTLPHHRPAARTASVQLDLVVLAEFVYYLPIEDRMRSLEMITQQTGPDAEIAAVHWRHHPHDAFLSGADVQAEIDTGLRAQGWRHGVHHEDPDFVFDTWDRGSSSDRSVM